MNTIEEKMFSVHGHRGLNALRLADGDYKKADVLLTAIAISSLYKGYGESVVIAELEKARPSYEAALLSLLSGCTPSDVEKRRVRAAQKETDPDPWCNAMGRRIRWAACRRRGMKKRNPTS